MTAKEFYMNVVKMREYQKEYFRSKGQNKDALRGAKDYERIIDLEIKRVQFLEKQRRQLCINFDEEKCNNGQI